MKTLWMIVLSALLLCGCAQEEVFETVADEWAAPVMAQPREVSIRLPDDAAAPVLESGTEQVYLSQHYEIIMEQLPAGDVSATIQAMSGYERENLTVMTTNQEDVTRYEFVWASAGEQGDRLGRGVILDDGSYHYCLSVLRDADMEETSQIVWSDVFGSFTLI